MSRSPIVDPFRRADARPGGGAAGDHRDHHPGADRRLPLDHRPGGAVAAAELLAARHHRGGRPSTSTARTSVTGVYGQEDLAFGFTVGRSMVAEIDDNTKTMVVKQDGQVINSIPVSLGSNKYPTYNGIHVVAEKYDWKIMDSSHLGADRRRRLPDRGRWATRISSSGEFVHAAPWSVGRRARERLARLRQRVDRSGHLVLRHVHPGRPGDHQEHRRAEPGGLGRLRRLPVAVRPVRRSRPDAVRPERTARDPRPGQCPGRTLARSSCRYL